MLLAAEDTRSRLSPTTNIMMQRRQFLKVAASAAVSFQIVPRNVLGQGRTPPSEKLNIAGIGVGGQGGGVLNDLKSEMDSSLQSEEARGRESGLCLLRPIYRGTAGGQPGHAPAKAHRMGRRCHARKERPRS